MDARTLEALIAEIALWEENRNAKRLADVRLGTKNGALCDVFYRAPWTCSGCPVAEKTGMPGCAGSPYQRADRALIAWVGAVFDDRDATAAHAAWVAAAQAEIDFLRSLLPAEADHG